MRTWKNGILLPFLLVLLWYIISKLQIFSSYLLPSYSATKCLGFCDNSYKTIIYAKKPV